MVDKRVYYEIFNFLKKKFPTTITQQQNVSEKHILDKETNTSKIISDIEIWEGDHFYIGFYGTTDKTQTDCTLKINHPNFTATITPRGPMAAETIKKIINNL